MTRFSKRLLLLLLFLLFLLSSRQIRRFKDYLVGLSSTRKSKYYLKLGDEEIKVNESDYNGYEPGDLVSMEIMDDPLLRRPKITLVERASERG